MAGGSVNGASGQAPLAELRGVSKAFGAIQSLSDVDLEVRAGEVLGLLGDNGAGKSTLIKLLSGCHRPDRGQLLWDGRPISLSSPAEARRLGIETVFQDLALVDTMNIARNFFLGKEPRRGIGPLRLLDRKLMLRETERMLEEIGISTVGSARQSVKTLSGGERQAIAIGRTMHFGAKLVILDEPTSALAVGETRKVLGYIRRAKERGLAVVFISHSLYDVHPVCDRLVVLQHGRKIMDAAASAVSVEDLADAITFKGQSSEAGPAQSKRPS